MALRRLRARPGGTDWTLPDGMKPAPGLDAIRVWISNDEGRTMAIRSRLITLLPAALALAACAAEPAVRETEAAPPPVVPQTPIDGPEGAELQVAEMVNQHRAGVGCRALQWDDRAADAARAHSEDMARRGYFSHRSPEGTQPGQRLSAQGVNWRAVAENIAQSGAGSATVVRGWLSSPGHRANIERCDYTHHGVGVSGDRWTHVFFAPR